MAWSKLQGKTIAMLSRGSALLVSILTFSVKASCEDLASATDPLSPGTFTTWVHSDEWKIRNASAAGPLFIPKEIQMDSNELIQAAASIAGQLAAQSFHNGNMSPGRIQEIARTAVLIAREIETEGFR